MNARVLGVGVVLAACLTGCGEDDEGGESPPTVGSPCFVEEGERCSGDLNLKCEDGRWTLKRDCTESDRRCVNVSDVESDCIADDED